MINSIILRDYILNAWSFLKYLNLPIDFIIKNDKIIIGVIKC